MRTDELYHYGIRGMKWGVRRYQNPDGTLTEAGKRRYDLNTKSGVKHVIKDMNSPIYSSRSSSNSIIKLRLNAVSERSRQKRILATKAINDEFNKRSKEQGLHNEKRDKANEAAIKADLKAENFVRAKAFNSYKKGYELSPKKYTDLYKQKLHNYVNKAIKKYGYTSYKQLAAENIKASQQRKIIVDQIVSDALKNIKLSDKKEKQLRRNVDYASYQ